MTVLVKAAAAVLVSSVCALMIKQKNPELSFVIIIMTAVCLMFAATNVLGELVELIKELIYDYGLSESVYKPVIKCVGIAIITKLLCSLCADAGQSSTAAAVEYLGCALAVLTAIPLLRGVLKTLEGLM